MNECQNKKWYNNPDNWKAQTDDLSSTEQQRFNHIVANLPDDVKTILDVGCGKGKVIRKLADLNREFYTLGLDLSEVALKSAPKPVLVSNSKEIPCKNDSFELVMATELIEHLPLNLYNQTLKELERVAKNYVFVSVPFQEVIEENLSKCISCNHIYHIWGHQRSFNEQDMKELFYSFKLRKLQFVESSLSKCSQV